MREPTDDLAGRPGGDGSVRHDGDGDGQERGMVQARRPGGSGEVGAGADPLAATLRRLREALTGCVAELEHESRRRAALASRLGPPAGSGGAGHSGLRSPPIGARPERSPSHPSVPVPPGECGAKRAEAARAQIGYLQAELAQARDETRRLAARLAGLEAEHAALQAVVEGQSRELRYARQRENRAANGAFWSLCSFFAVSGEFARYGAAVGYDLRRMFAVALLAEIRGGSKPSPEIGAHAAGIVDLFDPIHYLSEYPEVALSGANPLLHYVTVGCRRGCRPNPLFDPGFYRTQVAVGEADPLLHFATHGAAAGLKPHPLFDPAFYAERHPDAAAAGVNPLFHYQLRGARAGYDPSRLFDTRYFLAQALPPAVAEKPLEEYLTAFSLLAAEPHPLFSTPYFCSQVEPGGIAEAPLLAYAMRRELWTVAPHPLFQLDYLRERGVAFPPDLPPLEHFCRLAAGGDLGSHYLFDSALYRYQVEHELGRKLCDPPIIDYLKSGHRDRSILPNLLFDPQTYREANGVSAPGPELAHYCAEGDRAGVRCHEMFAGDGDPAQPGGSPGITALERYVRSPAASPMPARPIDGRVLQWIAGALRDSGEFDPSFYRACYPELGLSSDDEARRHFDGRGRAEGKFASPKRLLDGLGLRIRDLPLGFNADEYAYLNRDIARPGADFQTLFLHYLTIGRNEQRHFAIWQLETPAPPTVEVAAAVPFAADTGATHADVAILMHLYYPELLPELAAYVANFDIVSRDLFINIVDEQWTPALDREVRATFPGAFVQVSANAGRDIGGVMRLLDHVDFDRFELFALIHTKKSPHLPSEVGTRWRRELLNAFCGSRETVRDCVARFREDPGIGLIAAGKWRETDLGRNAHHYRKLLDRFEIGARHRDPEFAAGSMYLVRSAIVERLYHGLKSAEWEYGGGKGVEFHHDGQLAHAVERIVGNLVRDMGHRFEWR